MSEEMRKILEELEKTGYPLQVDVIDQLMKNGWSVFPEYTYYDKNTMKLRAIDAFAIYSPTEDLFELLIECKSSKAPWIVHCAPMVKTPNLKETKIIAYPSAGIDMLSVVSRFVGIFSLIPPGVLNRLEDGRSRLFKEAQKLHFFSNTLPKAYSCHELRKKTKEKPDSFTKALYQIRGAYLDLVSRETTPNTLRFASIVLRGKLFEHRRTESGPELIPREHSIYQSLSLLASSLPDSEKQKHPLPIPFIDIVTDSYFPKYLDLLRKDVLVLRNLRSMLKKEE